MEVQQAYRRRSSRWDCRIRYTAIYSHRVCATPATFAVKPFPRSSPLNGTKSSNTSSPWIARCAPSATRCSGRSTVWTITRASIIVGRNRAGYRRVCSRRAEETLCETSLVVETREKEGRKRKERRREGKKRCRWTTPWKGDVEEGRISTSLVDSMSARSPIALLLSFFFPFPRLFGTRVTVAFVVVPFFRRLIKQYKPRASKINGIVVNC